MLVAINNLFVGAIVGKYLRVHESVFEFVANTTQQIEVSDRVSELLFKAKELPSPSISHTFRLHSSLRKPVV